MIVEVRLFATLADSVDRATAAKPLEVQLTKDASVAELIDHLGLPAADVRLVVVDGRMIHDRATLLLSGCRVALFPPVGGG